MMTSSSTCPNCERIESSPGVTAACVPLDRGEHPPVVSEGRRLSSLARVWKRPT